MTRSLAERRGLSNRLNLLLEANASSCFEAHYRPAMRSLLSGWGLIYTDPLRGAIAVYWCEDGSHDVPATNGLWDPGRAGAEFPAWRVGRLTLPSVVWSLHFG